MDHAIASPAPAGAARRSLPALIDLERKRRRRRRIILIAAAVALPLLVAAVLFALRPRPVPMGERFRVQPVSHGDVTRVVRATGHVEAITQVSVGAEVSGRIAKVLVDFNDRVKAGQVLAQFDEKALDAQRVQIEAQLAAARAGLAQARVDLEQARRNRARSDALFGKSAQSEAEHESARSAEALAEARVSAATAQVAAQEASRSLARTNLEHAVVRSPIDGVVITRTIDPGQTVAAMLQTPVLFVVAADLERMRVVTAVDEADIGEVHEGQLATFTVNAFPDRPFEGRVTEVRNSPAVVQDVVTYGAVVEVQNEGLRLKPGMTASVKVRTAQAQAVARVPNGALHFVPPQAERGAGPTVWVLEAGGPRQVPVEPGISDGELTEVRGVPEGTQVLVELTPAGKKAYGLDHKK
ncbi:MAG: efflux RND transporter periplasmic adaptor subunit [Archangiaceae bacterium]|nr:efflux RND transporter periplasmic adaptor subunit [Archangiaceae bacterium]